MDETQAVDDAEHADADPNGEAPDAGDGIEDLAWPIPLAVAWPLAAVVVAVLAWRFGVDPVLASVLPFGALLSLLTVIDLRELRVPNAILKPSYVIAVPVLLISATSDWSDISLVRALIGGAALGAVYFLILFIYPPGMGWGDVKLAPLIGAQLAFFGWVPFVRSLIVSHLVSGLVALVIVGAGLLSRGRLRWKTAFPFGPFMAIGAVVALLLEGGTG
jgi:leader peptidase (prepilin peptidase)/N-methyltransferase